MLSSVALVAPLATINTFLFLPYFDDDKDFELNLFGAFTFGIMASGLLVYTSIFAVHFEGHSWGQTLAVLMILEFLFAIATVIYSSVKDKKKV